MSLEFEGQLWAGDVHLSIMISGKTNFLLWTFSNLKKVESNIMVAHTVITGLNSFQYLPNISNFF